MTDARWSLVIFDLDGVLVDTSPAHGRAYQELWREAGVDGPDYETIAGRRTVDVVRELLPGPPEPWVERKQRLAVQYVSDIADLYDDTRAVLAAVAATGVPVGLGTGASRAGARAILERFELTSYFDQVVTADDVEHGKPSPLVFELLMRRLGAQPEATLVIEDSRAGIAAAIASGARVASVRTGNTDPSTSFLGAFPDLRTMAAALGLPDHARESR